MEIINQEAANKTFAFNGKGNEFFGIVIVNWLLTVITLGLYYPWAKARRLQYYYSNTIVDGSNFTFSGTGKEMFMGFIKAIVLFGILYGVYFIALLSHNPVFLGLGVLFFLLGTALLLPLAIHGTLKYRLSRTTFRTIRFGYRGDLKTLTKLYFKNIFLTIITLTIYASWMQVNIRKYVYSNIRFGDVSFEFTGTGWEYFKRVFLGILLCYITLFIYIFWYVKKLIEFQIENSKIVQNGVTYDLKTTISAKDIFKISIMYFFGLLTLGIGLPWTMMYQSKKVMGSIEIVGDFNIDAVQQTEADYKDATGEDIGDMMNLDLTL